MTNITPKNRAILIDGRYYGKCEICGKEHTFLSRTGVETWEARIDDSRFDVKFNLGYYVCDDCKENFESEFLYALEESDLIDKFLFKVSKISRKVKRQLVKEIKEERKMIKMSERLNGIIDDYEGEEK